VGLFEDWDYRAYLFAICLEELENEMVSKKEGRKGQN